MPLSHADLVRLKSEGLTLAAILVYSFLLEYGHQPVARIAQACGLSRRAVYLALSRLMKSPDWLQLRRPRENTDE